MGEITDLIFFGILFLLAISLSALVFYCLKFNKGFTLAKEAAKVPEDDSEMKIYKKIQDFIDNILEKSYDHLDPDHHYLFETKILEWAIKKEMGGAKDTTGVWYEVPVPLGQFQDALHEVYAVIDSHKCQLVFPKLGTPLTDAAVKIMADLEWHDHSNCHTPEAYQAGVAKYAEAQTK